MVYSKLNLPVLSWNFLSFVTRLGSMNFKEVEDESLSDKD